MQDLSSMCAGLTGGESMSAAGSAPDAEATVPEPAGTSDHVGHDHTGE